MTEEDRANLAREIIDKVLRDEGDSRGPAVTLYNKYSGDERDHFPDPLLYTTEGDHGLMALIYQPEKAVEAIIAEIEKEYGDITAQTFDCDDGTSETIRFDDQPPENREAVIRSLAESAVLFFIRQLGVRLQEMLREHIADSTAWSALGFQYVRMYAARRADGLGESDIYFDNGSLEGGNQAARQRHDRAAGAAAYRSGVAIHLEGPTETLRPLLRPAVAAVARRKGYLQRQPKARLAEDGQGAISRFPGRLDKPTLE